MLAWCSRQVAGCFPGAAVYLPAGGLRVTVANPPPPPPTPLPPPPVSDVARNAADAAHADAAVAPSQRRTAQAGGGRGPG